MATFGSAAWPEKFAQLGGDDAVRLAGNPAWVDYLRRMVTVATQ